MDQPKARMAISDLSNLSGIPTSTIKFYIRKDMLPKPLTSKGTHARYTFKHLERLKLIKKIQKEGMPLNKIKEILQVLNSGEKEMYEDLDANTSHIKSTLIQAAISLFREKGYETVTIADIVDSAHIGCSTFYKNFRNKKDLFAQSIKKIIADEAQLINANVIDEDENILSVFEKGADVFLKQGELWRDMINMLRTAAKNDPDEFSDILEEAMRLRIDSFEKEIKKGLELGYIRNINKTLLAVIILGIQEYCSEFFSKNKFDDAKKKEMFEEAKSIVLKGILK